ncbi:U3 small nucleolar ribonucleoprotein protein MPP10-like [Nylanderia fulva]|uniref:U3 small nucleolar ribonucleoprotein protein MPP10-like n=1 Tax=Nylanderia fulva TaxID=613905 RepID=UPI0010FB98B6|nr:U3 small nucleolar ribonucleoprotein protein MPP10-like [Nylanderia fulva]
MASIDFLDSVVSSLNSIQSLEQVKSGKTKVDITDLTKRVYDFTKEQSSRNTNALPELVTEGFDEEQIWQQLELQNQDEIKHFSNEISKILVSKKKLVIPVSSLKPELVEIENDNFEQENEGISDDKESEDESKEIKNNLRKRKRDEMKKKKSSIVDDKFFKLQELDEYLIKEEKKEKQDENDTESDDESVDLFNDISEEENEDNTEGKYIKYADFFDNPESENEQQFKEKHSDYNDINDSEEEKSESEDEEMDAMDDEEDENEQNIKRVRFNLTNDSDETDSLENKTNHSKEINTKDEEMERNMDPSSTLEARKERLLMRIKELEEKSISEKPWQFKGEVGSSTRPQNSVLEEFLEVDVNTKPPPAITEETTLKLEDIIKQRIKDKTWDDVEKKFKPVETPLEYKKQLVLDQEKSKESLSQIYEKAYLQQKQALDPENNEKKEEVPQLHNEIRQTMRSLMSKLDALSNYHYTPKLAKPEIKIISNVPAIRMEEVAPTATSDATLLAPEEIKTKPRGDIIGKSERTKTDMKRDRRRKKLRQRTKQQAVEKKEKLKALKPGISKKYEEKKERDALLKKVTKDRNIRKLDETTHKVAKSSTAFFTQLQNQVKNKIKKKDNSSKRKNNIDSAVKLKL